MCKVYTEAGPFRSTLKTRVTLGLGMCKVCTEAVHCVALWTRVYIRFGQMCKVCTEAVHCVALWTRVTLGLGMCPCQVCTEARDATKNAKKRVQKPKLGPAKRARKRERGPFQGRRTSRFAGKYRTSKTREKTKKTPHRGELSGSKKEIQREWGASVEGKGVW